MKKSESSVVIPVIIPTDSMLKTYNCYLIKTKEHLTLVDAAIDDDQAYRVFLDVLKKNQLKISDITQIVLTHNHSDHTGFVKRIREQTNVNVYAHPTAFLRLTRDEAFLRRRIEFFNQIYNESACGERGKIEARRMQEALIKNENLRVNHPILSLVEGDYISEFKVIEVPGHSIDHIALYNEKTGELIAGDLILEHAPSNALIEMGLEGELLQTLYLYEKSLKRCAELQLSTIYPGHGIIITEDANELFNKRINSIIRKSKRIKESIIEQEQPAADLAKSMYKDRYDTLFVLVMSEVIGHLERLVLNNEIVKEYKDSVYVYSEKR